MSFITPANAHPRVNAPERTQESSTSDLVRDPVTRKLACVEARGNALDELIILALIIKKRPRFLDG